MNESFSFLIGLPKRVIKNAFQLMLNALMPSLLEYRITQSFPSRIPGKPHGLPKPLILSLTSYPARFEQLPLTLKCLLSQTVKADRIILWVAYQHKDALTPSIMELQKYGLEIEYCDDLRSFKKIIPTLTRYDDSFIVTADDDLYYWPTWLEELVQNYRGNPKEVICHRTHHIRMGVDNLPLPYSRWELEKKTMHVSALNFPTSGAGVLYPPHVFCKDVLDVDMFDKLCPNADDIWLYWMMRLNEGVARKVGGYRYLYCWNNTQKSALSDKNMMGGNDAQIAAMIHTYGMPL